MGAHRSQNESSDTVSMEKVNQLQALLEDRYNRHQDRHGALKLAAVRRMTHESAVNDPRGRRIFPEDLRSFLGSLGANASLAEVDALISMVKGRRSADGSISTREFH